MEVSQSPGQSRLHRQTTDSSLTVGQAEEPPGHRWAGILGTGVAILTLTLPITMIASYSPFSSNAQPVPQTIPQPQVRVNQME